MWASAWLGLRFGLNVEALLDLTKVLKFINILLNIFKLFYYATSSRRWIVFCSERPVGRQHLYVNLFAIPIPMYNYTSTCLHVNIF